MLGGGGLRAVGFPFIDRHFILGNGFVELWVWGALPVTVWCCECAGEVCCGVCMTVR